MSLSGATYIVRLDSTAVTAAKTLLQVKAGAAAPLELISAKISQITKTTTELLNIQILRKSAAATVTSFTPLKLDPGNPTAAAVGGTAATGINATVEGTDTDIILSEVWNILNGVWQYLPLPEERIWVPAAGILGIKLNTAPAASMNIIAELKFREFQ
jgi:hypothetical protein